MHYNADNSYLLVNRKEILKFKTINKYFNFQTQFCLGSIYNESSVAESKEVSLNGNLYDFPVNYNAIYKFNILNIQVFNDKVI